MKPEPHVFWNTTQFTYRRIFWKLFILTGDNWREYESSRWQKRIGWRFLWKLKDFPDHVEEKHVGWGCIRWTYRKVFWRLFWLTSDNWSDYESHSSTFNRFFWRFIWRVGPWTNQPDIFKYIEPPKK